MPSFFLLGVLPQVQETPTMKLHALLDWNDISHKLKGLYRREETHGGGQTPYDPLSMFKAMLLGQWHGLSDTQLEQRPLHNSLDFHRAPLFAQRESFFIALTGRHYRISPLFGAFYPQMGAPLPGQ